MRCAPHEEVARSGVPVACRVTAAQSDSPNPDGPLAASAFTRKGTRAMAEPGLDVATLNDSFNIAIPPLEVGVGQVGMNPAKAQAGPVPSRSLTPVACRSRRVGRGEPGPFLENGQRRQDAA